MLRFLCDEDFNGKVFDGLLRRSSELGITLDIVRVQDVNLSGDDDPTVLAWAAARDRVVLTQDKTTMPVHADDRVRAGERMPGVFVIDDQATFGEVIDDILLLDRASEPSEWVGRIERIPFRWR